MPFWSSKWIQFKAFLHRQTFPGFKGIPIAVILKYLWKEIWRDDIVTRANSMAYSFFLSIFPGLLVFLALLPYLPIGNMVSALRRGYVGILPKEMSDYIDSIIIEMTQTSREGLLSVSIALALVFASNGVLSMIKGFHKSYEMTYKKQNTLQQRWRALKLTMVLGVLFLGSLATIILGKPALLKLVSFAGVSVDNYRFLNFMRWTSVFIFYYMCIAIIYRIGPAYKNKEKLFSPGAMLATILSLLSSLGFAVYVENFAQYNEIYGSIGALILILLWLQINSFIILLGYELNASIAINRDLLAYKEEHP
ncbi:MAG TPA: YihY/virulence factor BrkB family protein [Saprospiraceae bacterium]|nr:YihY/virulence factor BrkB family protein [Saprospiraceae bacterium]